MELIKHASYEPTKDLRYDTMRPTNIGNEIIIFWLSKKRRQSYSGTFDTQNKKNWLDYRIAIVTREYKKRNVVTN